MAEFSAGGLSGKVALITGGARGIGRACAEELARAGADVAFCDLGGTETAAGTLAGIAAAGRRGRYHRCDIADRGQVEAMFAALADEWGRLDVLVNNAAFSIRKPLIELEVEDVRKTWDVCLWGVFHCSQLAARQMVKQGEGGAIVSISSVHAFRPFARSTAYNAAKAALNQMSGTWAVELAPHRIRVNVIEPGWIDTPGERAFYTEEQLKEEGARLPLGRLGRPEEIARAVRFLASEDASYVTGSVMRVDGGIVLPR